MTAPGWYDDGTGRQRWWDGSQWTDSYAPGQPAGTPPPPAAVAPPQNVPKNVWGVLSLVAGIAAIVLAWALLGAVVGVAGLVFGAIGVAAARKGLATNKQMSVWGIILSVVAMVLAAVFLTVYLVFGARVGTDGPPGPGLDDPGTAPTAPTDTAPTTPDGEFPIGDGYTVALTIRTETLEPPQGLGGQEPTEADYSLDWGPAVATDGQIAVVTATIRNTGETTDVSPASVSLMNADLAEYESLNLVQRFDLTLFNLDVPAGTTQTLEFAYAMPASDLDRVVVEFFLQTDLGEGHRITAFPPQPGQGCEELQQTDLPEVAFWSCLQVER